VGRVGHGPPKILVGHATVHLATPIIGSLIFRKISKISATRCQILMPKCTKFAFHWGSTQHPTGGAYSAPPPEPLAVFKGTTSKGGRARKGKGERRGSEGFGPPKNLGMAPLYKTILCQCHC